jgi:hypothetical protein
VIIPIACIVAIAVIAWLLFVRPSDLPAVEPVNPAAHLVERRAAIYENLRDLQFEFRVGKLSDTDYQQTKRDLQKELAGVLAGIDRIQSGGSLEPAVAAVAGPANGAAAKAAARMAATKEDLAGPPYTCPSCHASFQVDLKFCGECGKPMKETVR